MRTTISAINNLLSRTSINQKKFKKFKKMFKIPENEVSRELTIEPDLRFFHQPYLWQYIGKNRYLIVQPEAKKMCK